MWTSTEHAFGAEHRCGRGIAAGAAMSAPDEGSGREAGCDQLTGSAAAACRHLGMGIRLRDRQGVRRPSTCRFLYRTATRRSNTAATMRQPSWKTARRCRHTGVVATTGGDETRQLVDRACSMRGGTSEGIVVNIAPRDGDREAADGRGADRRPHRRRRPRSGSDDDPPT